MSSNFPNSLDTSTTLPAEGASTPLSTNHVTAHQNIQDALEAVEAKVGVDSSAVTTSHDYKLSEVTATDKAVGKTASQVLTNKTLTSPVINVTSDATGDIYYRNSGGLFTRLAAGTNGFILKLAAGIPSWAAETVTVDASATAKGIVEIATSAEITAGTATGGTGAILAISPDQLALSTPVFNGSGLTAIPRFLTSGAPATVVANATTAVLTYSLAGGILSTDKGVKIRTSMSVVNTAVNGAFTCNIKYGGTTISSFGYSGVSGTPTFTSVFVAEVLLMGSGATGTQRASGLVTQSGTTFAAVASPTQGSSSIDSTASQNIVIEFVSSSSAVSATFSDYFIEKIV